MWERGDGRPAAYGGAMTAMTRGPLPARVYWVRRVLAISLVTALVLGIVQLVSMLVGGGSPQEPDRAAPVAAEVTPTPSADPTAEDTEGPKQGKKQTRKQKKQDREPVLADPEGPCLDRDVAVTPTARDTIGGDPITFTLELRTVQSLACTWEVSPDNLTVKVTSGDDDIWSSRQCPRAVPTQDVVLRNNVTTEVDVTWSARRSDEGCTKLTGWALPGWYHVEAAALAGEPSDLQFRLVAPEGEVITEKVPPKDEKRDKKQRDRQQGEQQRDRGRST